MKLDYKKYIPSFFQFYVTGVFLVWSFFLALALAGPEEKVVENVGNVILVGGLASLLWPLIVMAKLMHMILF